MADTFLSPLGDYEPIGSFCGVRDASNNLDFVRAVDVAAAEVRKKCGPVLLEEDLSFESDRWAPTLVLPHRVATLESVTDAGGISLTLAYFRAAGQLVYRRDGAAIGPCTVVYSSGWARESIPVELVGAGFEIARHLWRTQLGNQRTGDEQGGAWLWPRQALALAEDWFLAPLGFA